MGHVINYAFLAAKTKAQAMKEGLKMAEDFAFYNTDRMENPGGSYHGWFRFYDKTFDNEQDAIDFFDIIGAYHDGVTKVRKPLKSSETKYYNRVAKIRQKQKDLKEKYKETFSKRTSATIGCKHCGTRITTEVALKNNLYCPHCRAWLVPESVQKKYQILEQEIAAAEETLKEETRTKGTVKYWVKVEVHC